MKTQSQNFSEHKNASFETKSGYNECCEGERNGINEFKLKEAEYEEIQSTQANGLTNKSTPNLSDLDNSKNNGTNAVYKPHKTSALGVSQWNPLYEIDQRKNKRFPNEELANFSNFKTEISINDFMSDGNEEVLCDKHDLVFTVNKYGRNMCGSNLCNSFVDYSNGSKIKEEKGGGKNVSVAEAPVLASHQTDVLTTLCSNSNSSKSSNNIYNGIQQPNSRNLSPFYSNSPKNAARQNITSPFNLMATTLNKQLNSSPLIESMYLSRQNLDHSSILNGDDNTSDTSSNSKITKPKLHQARLSQVKQTFDSNTLEHRKNSYINSKETCSTLIQIPNFEKLHNTQEQDLQSTYFQRLDKRLINRTQVVHPNSYTINRGRGKFTGQSLDSNKTAINRSRNNSTNTFTTVSFKRNATYPLSSRFQTCQEFQKESQLFESPILNFTRNFKEHVNLGLSPLSLATNSNQYSSSSSGTKTKKNSNSNLKNIQKQNFCIEERDICEKFERVLTLRKEDNSNFLSNSFTPPYQTQNQAQISMEHTDSLYMPNAFNVTTPSDNTFQNYNSFNSDSDSKLNSHLLQNTHRNYSTNSTMCNVVAAQAQAHVHAQQSTILSQIGFNINV